MKFNKILAFISITILLFLSNTVVKSQSNAPITTIQNRTTCSYSLISVPITVNNFTNVWAISLRIEYDTTILHFEPFLCTYNSNLYGFNFDSDTVASSNTIRKIGISANFGTGLNLDPNSIMATLVFFLKSGTTTLSFNNVANGGHDCEYASCCSPGPYAMNDNPPPPYYFNGQVSSNSTQNPNWGFAVTTGGSVINPGGYTATLTTSGFSGSIVSWQREYSGKGFENIPGTSGLTSYSEIPTYNGNNCTGIYKYRALIEYPTCDSTVSIPTTVIVTMPGTPKVWSSQPSGVIYPIDDYNQPGNWTPCGVPLPSEDIEIPVVPANRAYPVVKTNGFGCHNVLIDSGASLTVQSGITFTVTGTFTHQP